MEIFFEVPGDNGLMSVELEHYSPGAPMRITGWGFGDAEPPEPEEIDYRVTIGGEPYEPTEQECEKIEQVIREAKDDYEID
jgi:hypothetical protein